MDSAAIGSERHNDVGITIAMAGYSALLQMEQMVVHNHLALEEQLFPHLALYPYAWVHTTIGRKDFFFEKIHGSFLIMFNV